MVVNFVRQHWAQPGVTVTESKFLYDAQSQIEREVDIVIEGTFDGEPIVTSVEVIEHGRPATIEWVEQQINKHRHLPTNRLVLVSKSGFSKNARTRVAVEGGWVDAVTPQAVDKDGQPIVKSLSIGHAQMKPVACRLYVQPPGEEIKQVNIPADMNIYDSSGTFLGVALELAAEIMGLDFVREKILKDARNHPERADLKAFEFAAVILDLGYYLHWEADDELHPIAAIEIEGEFAFSQEELTFSINDIGNLRYGVGEASLLGHPAIWVATTNEETQTTTISWRAKDNKPFAFGTGHFQATKFPAVMNLKPPPSWLEGPNGSHGSGQPENSHRSQV
jgi:hypothetical protein